MLNENSRGITSKEFAEFLQDYKIHRQLTCLGTPQENGVAKRKNRHLVEL